MLGECGSGLGLVCRDNSVRVVRCAMVQMRGKWEKKVAEARSHGSPRRGEVYCTMGLEEGCGGERLFAGDTRIASSIYKF